MAEVLALEDDALALGGEASGLVQRRRTPDVALCEAVELDPEGGVTEGLAPTALEVVERRDERLGDVAAAVRAVEPGRSQRAAST
jgi:hypothetical protein